VFIFVSLLPFLENSSKKRNFRAVFTDFTTMTAKDIINIDPELMGGTPVFRGTRVPIQSLFDHLEGNIPLEEFLDDFPTVSKDQAIALLEMAFHSVLNQAQA
jgi:uncharacterized protein (DUF433 family)